MNCVKAPCVGPTVIWSTAEERNAHVYGWRSPAQMGCHNVIDFVYERLQIARFVFGTLVALIKVLYGIFEYSLV